MDIDSMISQSERKSKQKSGEDIREKERSKKRPFYILSCDGGGVRSLATAHFLLSFETHVKSIFSGFRLYKFFDMYAGTSAGGILTGLCVYGEKEMKELVEIYCKEKLKEIFSKSWLDSMFGKFQSSPVYDGKAKTKMIKDTVGDVIFREVPNGKHIVIPAYDIEHASKIFYSGDRDSALVTAAGVIDATSAAPVYFPAVKVDDRWYMDGGVVANNPTMCAITVAKKILGQNSGRKIVVINIGTGSRTQDIDGRKASTYGGIQWLFHDIFRIPLNNSLVEEQSKLIIDDYLRINCDLGDIVSDLDNTNTGNMEKLCELGRSWWETHADDMMELLKDHPFLDTGRLENPTQK
jgi:predicted acylesterase/phospholipase RssA